MRQLVSFSCFIGWETVAKRGQVVREFVNAWARTEMEMFEPTVIVLPTASSCLILIPFISFMQKGPWLRLIYPTNSAFNRHLLVRWRRLLRVSWTARRSNQSILKEISSGCSLEGLMLELKLQYLGHFMRRVDSWKRPWCWEGLGAGRAGDDRGWDGWMASPTRWTWAWVNSGSWSWTGRPGVLRFMGLQRVRHDWATELNSIFIYLLFFYLGRFAL